MLARAPVLALLLLVAVPAQATVLHDWSIEERIARSDNVVIGTITSQQAKLVDGNIVTESSVSVTRTLFGPARRDVVLTQLGGTIGDTTLDIAGSARFEVGDEVVLIVKRDEHGREQLVGMSLGAFLVKGKRVRQTIDVPLMRDGRLREGPGEQIYDIERIRGAAREVRRTLERAGQQ